MKTKNNLKSKLYEKNNIGFGLTLFVLIIGACMQAGIAIMLQEILDTAISGSKEDILRLLLIVLIYASAMVAIWLVERYVRNMFLEKAMRQLKEELFSRLTRKSISSFSEETSGRYLSIFTNDMNSVESNYLQSQFKIIMNCVYFVAAIGIMLWYDPLMTGCVFVLLVASLLVSVLFGGKLAKEEKGVSDQNERFVGLIKDLLSGFSLMKSFQAEKELTNLFVEENRLVEWKKCHRRKMEALINLVGNSCGILVQAGVMLLGACFTIEGRITAGVLIAFVQLMNYVIMPVQQIPPALANRKAAEGLLAKMEEVVNVNAVMQTGEKIEDLQKGICFRNVSFGYEADKELLNDINLEFEAGKSYAIVGASGSGKSTILNLLLGGYPGYSGEIQIGGIELRKIASESLYSHLAVVQQNVFIYNNTIENNITMFREPDAELFETIMEKIGLTNLIEEKGLSYICGENGSGLSGGEKQRISIARSLLQNPAVLLMDEATSALDAENGALIERMIVAATDMTRIVVTHKMNEDVLKQYDRIIVVQNGRIAGNGTYEELEENCEYFKQLLMA